MSLHDSLARIRETPSRRIESIRATFEPLGDRPLTARQIATRIAPVLPLIAKAGIQTDDPEVTKGVGLAIEKLYNSQEKGDANSRS